MKKVFLGLILAMSAIILINSGQPFIGLPLFIAGIYLMMKKRD